MSMAGPLYLLSCLLMCVSADNNGAVPSSASPSVNATASSYVPQQVEVNDSKERVSQCEFMKNLFGVSYNQMQGDNAPHLNLSLVYRNKIGTQVFSIETAAQSLRKQRTVHEDKRLVLFVHGFMDSPTKDAFTSMTQVFMTTGHINLIALDASSALSWIYLRSTAYVRFIGQRLGQALADIVQQSQDPSAIHIIGHSLGTHIAGFAGRVFRQLTGCEKGQDPSAIHIIGHSLGAHIAGFAGRAFRERTGRSVGRVSGLDPAGPCYNDVPADERLRRTDADYVTVVHTNTAMFGIEEPVGHKDYYPNGGSTQPNCVLLGCSHNRAWALFAESVVNALAFPAVRCKDWDAFKKGQCESEISYMGYSSKASGSEGLYFLQTGGKNPYGLGLNGTQYKKTSFFG